MTISLLRLWSRGFLDSDYLRNTSKIFSLPTPYSTLEYTIRYEGVKMVAYPKVWTAVYSYSLKVVHLVRLGGWEGG